MSEHKVVPNIPPPVSVRQARLRFRSGNNHHQKNLEAAVAILSRPAEFPEHSLAGRWAALYLQRPQIRPLDPAPSLLRGCTMRPERKEEAFELRCHACQCVVEFPVERVRQGLAQCPRCGAQLKIAWRPA